jgi:hypothetical protein
MLNVFTRRWIMSLTNVILQKTYQETYLNYIESIKNYKTEIPKSSSGNIDKIDISNETQFLRNSGLNLLESSITRNNTNIDFKYNFSDSIIQVQSNGNYNSKEKSGYINFSINLSELLIKEKDKISILPKELSIQLNFKIIEKNYTKETENYTKKPDILTIIRKIVERILELVKDGQNKDIKLYFENQETLSNFFQVEKGKLAKMILAWLEAISKRINLDDKDGKRENIIILIPDEKLEIEYEKQNLSINIISGTIKLNFDSGDSLTLLLNPENEQNNL